MSGKHIKNKKAWIDSLRRAKSTEDYRVKMRKQSIRQWDNMTQEEKSERMRRLQACKKAKQKYEWSNEYERCIDCKTIKRPHLVKGRCRECHNVWYRKYQQVERDLKRKTTYFNDGKFYGTRGVIIYDSDIDELQCHLCGNWYKFLSNHIASGHKISLEDYREEFDLNRRQKFANQKLRKGMSETLKRTEAKNGVPDEVRFWRANINKMYANAMKGRKRDVRLQFRLDKKKFMKSIGGWQAHADAEVIKNWKNAMQTGRKQAYRQGNCKQCGEDVIEAPGKRRNTLCAPCKKLNSRLATERWMIKNFGSKSNYHKHKRKNDHSVEPPRTNTQNLGVSE